MTLEVASDNAMSARRSGWVVGPKRPASGVDRREGTKSCSQSIERGGLIVRVDRKAVAGGERRPRCRRLELEGRRMPAIERDRARSRSGRVEPGSV